MLHEVFHRNHRNPVLDPFRTLLILALRVDCSRIALSIDSCAAILFAFGNCLYGGFGLTRLHSAGLPVCVRIAHKIRFLEDPHSSQMDTI